MGEGCVHMCQGPGVKGTAGRACFLLSHTPAHEVMRVIKRHTPALALHWQDIQAATHTLSMSAQTFACMLVGKTLHALNSRRTSTNTANMYLHLTELPLTSHHTCM